jgi:hypothetical protein
MAVIISGWSLDTIQEIAAIDIIEIRMIFLTLSMIAYALLFSIKLK